MVEAYTSIENTMLYYGNKEVKGSHFPFNFLFITDLISNVTAQNVVDTVNKWMSYLPKKYVANWVVS